MKKALILLLCAALCLGLFGCVGGGNSASSGSEADPAAAQNEIKPYKFCASYPASGSGFYSMINSAIQTAVRDKGDRLILLDPGGDQATQILQIEDMLTEGIDAMILSPIDPAGMQPALQALRQAGVPVINVGLQVEDTDLVDYVVVADMAEAGALCAGDALARQPDGGRMLVLEHAANPLDTAAVAAWDKAVAGEAWETVGRFESSGRSDTACAAVEAYLEENPGAVDVIFAGTDAAAVGAVTALQNRGVKQGTVLVYGVGGTPEAKQLINGGWMTATASQSPGAIGARAAQIAYQLMENSLPKKENHIEVTLVTPENIGEQSLNSWS